MNKGGNGIGSAAIVLIFAILCMTIFSLISLQTSLSDRALADAQERYVLQYYSADSYAEYILSEILKEDYLPETVDDIEIFSYYDFERDAEVIAFACEINENKELSVEVAFEDGSILKWRVEDTNVWEMDNEIHVWSGSNPWDDDDDFDFPDEGHFPWED